MTKTGKLLMFAALICLAILCILVGSVTGAFAFIALGLILEAAFWLGIFKQKTKL